MVAAFVIACLSFVTASLSAAWQVYAWVFEGRRVRVALVHGGMSGTAAITKKVTRNGQRMDPRGVRGFGALEEVLGVSVTNVGRATVRIDGYDVVLKDGGLAFRAHGSGVGPRLPYRLPPGESETWYVRMSDVRALATSERSIRPGAQDLVFMCVTLGTGDEARTKRTLRALA